ncbi:ribosomal-protein-alanine N-acetyltransferase [Enhygromyxa salina]|uniref:Ribosomal-protein-alanine N-acetyltransferase n=1 Tax=Enhygromyxa salina TaxID=215803 RepID=A0A2S9YFZ6_9BACT|nr:GNAT family N-acetyltransferase [Enhygromyxa salina]PRQ04034.1 ribosomal-protein-alanine N-acetyltransferase [Enhygromyxa salina]
MTFIRLAALADLPDLLELDAACFSRPWAADAWRAELDHGAGLFLAGAPAPTGLACARVIAGRCELRRIGVDPRARGRGVGRDLLRAIMVHARQAGCSGIELEVAAGNVAACSLYRSQGFEVVGRRPAYYRDPPDDALLMDLVFGQESP